MDKECNAGWVEGRKGPHNTWSSFHLLALRRQSSGCSWFIRYDGRATEFIRVNLDVKLLK